MAAFGRRFGRNFPTGRIYAIWLICWSFVSIVAGANDDVNFGPETPKEEKLEFSLREGAAPGTVVGRLTKRPGYSYRLNEKNGFFDFDPSTGEIRVVADRSLDRESLPDAGYKNDQVELVILGSGRTPSDAYFTTINVRVEDINDNAPSFPFAFQNVSLPESARVGTRLVLASANDADLGDNGKVIDYRLLGGNDDGVFRLYFPDDLRRQSGSSPSSPIDRSTVYLELARTLDRETQPLHVLNVSASDGGRPPLTGFLTVFVNVLDANDNQPQFERLQYDATVPSTLPIGGSILTVRATDRDSGENGRVSYAIGNDPQKQFRVDPGSGLVTSARPLTCPETSSGKNRTRLCTFTIEAIDRGVPSQRGRAFVNVRLSESIDRTPQILFRYYSSIDSNAVTDSGAVVDQSKPIGAVVAVVTVTEANNSDLKLRIESGNELRHFRLESNNFFSVLRINQTLKRASHSRYNLTIIAEGKKNTSIAIRRSMPIFITDPNDRPPKFRQSLYRSQIDEGAQIGSYVADVKADTDDDESILYEMTNESLLLNGKFRLDRQTGLITIAGEIDFDEPVLDRNFSLTINARYVDRPSIGLSTTTVQIEVADVNDRSPTFDQPIYDVELAENTKIGTTIARVTATDADSGENGRIRYRFDPSERLEMEQLFQLNSADGSLTLKRSLDRELTDHYRFTILANDNGRPSLSGRARVEIRVLDANDNAPTFVETEIYANLHVSSLHGSVVANVLATDEDDGPNGQIRYYFLQPPPIKTISIDQTSGEIYLKSRLMQSISKFELILGAEDGQGLRSVNNCTVHVQLLDYGNVSLPRFAKESYTFRVAEDSDISAVDGRSSSARSIGTVSATDFDAPVAEYGLLNGGDRFEIGRYSGEIRSRRSLDYETKSSYQIRVLAMGKLGVSTAPVIVDLIDLNDNKPTFRNGDRSATIGQSTPAGYPFYFASATDPDSNFNGWITYRLSDQSSKEFRIDNATGAVSSRVAGYLLKYDYYTLDIIASDNGQPSRSANMQINVSVDQNVEYAQFVKAYQNFFVDETTSVNERFARLNLTNTDVRYRIETANEDDRDDFGIFPDGWLYVRQPLSYERRSQFSTVVLATTYLDQGSTMTSQCLINVFLIDRNSHAPVCTNQTFRFRLLENAGPMAYVGTVTAEDSDSNLKGFVQYRLIDERQLFHLHPSTGQLIALRSFDREQLIKTRSDDAISLQFEAEDLARPPLKTVCRIEVIIDDANDHAPQFSLDVYAASVQENLSPGAEVLKVSATDGDQSGDDNSRLEFLLVDGDPDGDFQLDASTGRLITRRKLDRERKDVYRLRLLVRDFGRLERLNSSAFATVLVTDVNDNQPRFEESLRTVQLSERTPIGTVLINIRASDPDVGSAGVIDYSLIDHDGDEQYFDLDSVSGRLMLIKELDFEFRRNFSLIIGATDRGSPPMNATCRLVVNVLDENDNEPVINSSNPIANLRPDAVVGSVIGTVTAQDADSELNGRVEYHLIDQKPFSAFRIDSQSGQITLINRLNADAYPQIDLLVEVSDMTANNSQRLSSRKVITVTIDDNFSPIDCLWPTASTVAATTSGYRVADFRRCGNISLELKSNSGIFELTDGVLTIKKSIDSPRSLYLAQIDTVWRENNVNGVMRQSINYTIIPNSAANRFRFEKPQYKLRVNANQLENRTDLERLMLIGASDVQFYVTKSRSQTRSSQNAKIVDIDRDTGRLFIVSGSAIRSNLPTSVILDVTAVDYRSDQPSSTTCQVTIDFDNIEDNLRLKFSRQFYRFHITEDAPVGASVGRVELSNKLINGDQWRFQMTNRSVPFGIDASSGVISLRSTIDRETIDIYDQLQIGLTDGNNWLYASVLIEVTDVNDNAPIVPANFSFTIMEGLQIDRFVGKVTAIDRDSGANANLQYSLVSLAANFTIESSTGIVRANGMLDREQMPIIHFKVQIHDNGNPPKKATTDVFVEILDLNDNAPVLETIFHEISLYENASIGTSLLQLIASDVDTDTDLRYEIVSGNVWGLFAVDVNGTLTVAGSLDRETRAAHHLVVAVHDQSSDVTLRHSVYAQVTVQVLDVNDCPPRFISADWTAVSADVQPGDVLAVVKATDGDEAAAGDLNYRLLRSNCESFSIDAISGELRLIDRLCTPADDVVDRTMYRLVIRAFDHGRPMLHADQQFSVYVADGLGGQPTFVERRFETTVAEDTPVGSSLFRIPAVDRRTGANVSALFWTDDSGDAGLNDLAVFPDTGVLYVARSLDFERRTAYDLTVWVAGSPTDNRTDRAEVRVRVTDVNDNHPTFDRSPMLFRVTEGEWTEPIGVGILSATDADSGANGKLSYSIIQGDTGLFSIDSLSGQLLVHGHVDRETLDVYVLVVEVADSGTPRLSTTSRVIILILDINDNQPVFTKPRYSAFTEENQPNGTVVLQVSAIDLDSGDNGLIKYTLEENVDLPFVIDETTGVISLKKSIDREVQSVYRFNVIASDSASDARQTTVEVQITVGDLNDNPPVIADLTQDVYVNSSISQGDLVFVVEAQDADQDENARLTFSLGGRDARLFDISPENGVITAKTRLNTGADFAVDVFVTDNGRPSLNASTSLRFFPQSGADFPSIDAWPTVDVAENETGKLLGVVKARSAKLNRLVYAILAGNIGQAFVLEPLTGRLLTTGQLDFETRRQYELFVAATDGDSPPLTTLTKIVVRVQDCNDNAPQFAEMLYETVVVEEQSPPLIVVQVKATDADSGVNGQLRYSLENHQDLFAIDSESGLIRTKATADRERTGEYQLVVVAADLGRPQLTSRSLVVVKVADTNDNAPRFSRLFAADVREDAAVGSFVTQVTSSDADAEPANANNTYYFSTNDTTFAIDQFSGNVSVAAPLDRESAHEYQLKVVAVDGAWRVETSLTINILDVNDNAPVFSRAIYAFNISELQPPLTVIGRVQAIDPDGPGSNSRVRYRLLQKSALFTIDSSNGDLRTSKTLRIRDDQSQQDVHQLIVVASDDGRPSKSSSAAVIVQLIKKDQLPPVFEKPAVVAALPSELTVGTKIVRITAKNQRNSSVFYALDDKIVNSSRFDIDAETGWIFATGQSSNPVGTQFKLSVNAYTGNNSPRAYQEVMLIVVESNKIAPEFSSSSYTMAVPENTPPGTAIFTVSARDTDPGLNGQVMYRLLGSDGGSANADMFAIDEDTGVILLTRSLDFELTRWHRLTIEASDRGHRPLSTKALLTVGVQDVNDNAPTFSRQRYEARMLENSPKGSVVIRLNATDRDSSPYNSIMYAIENGNDDGAFSIDPVVGAVMVNGQLDYERRSIYKLTVKCRNPDLLDLSSLAVLTVYIQSVDEFPPKFEHDHYEFLAQQSIDTDAVIGRVGAIDQDAGEDGRVFYAVQSPWLSVDNSGQIRATKKFKNEPPPEGVVSASVFAYNRRLTRTTMISCNVTVRSAAKSAPKFLKYIYEAQILENAPDNTSILTMETSTSNDRPIYEIEDGNDQQRFAIDADTGVLRLRQSIDRESIASYNLTVAAYDSRRQFRNTAQALIKVLDVNDNPPMLSDESSLASLSEGDPIGTGILTLSPEDADSIGNQEPFRFLLLNNRQRFAVDPTTGVLRNLVIFDREIDQRFVLSINISDAGQPPQWAVSNVTVLIADRNDNPSTSNAVQLTVIGVAGKTAIDQSILLADATPNDPDAIGDYRCGWRSNHSAFRLEDCVLRGNLALLDANDVSLQLTGTDGRHQWVNYDLKLKQDQIPESFLTNSVRLTVIGDRNRLIQSFLSEVNSALISRRTQARIVHVSPSSSLDDDLWPTPIDLDLTLMSDDGSAVPTAKSVEILRQIRTAWRKDSRFRLLSIFDGYCARGQAPCRNDGQCVDLVTFDPQDYGAARENERALAFPTLTRAYRCNCKDGFVGEHCQTTIDRCASSPCASGATCRDDATLKAFVCECPTGFAGRLCDQDIDECRSINGTSASVCENGGHCENTRGNFRCLCLVGFSGDRCQQSGDICASSPCRNGGTCRPMSDDTFSCLCPFGYTGQQCQLGSLGFDESSHIQLSLADDGSNRISFELATLRANSLLLFGYGSSSSSASSDQFWTLELIDGRLRLVISADGRQTESILESVALHDSRWRRVQIDQKQSSVRVSLSECPANENDCVPCSGDSCQITMDNVENSMSGSMFVGGAKDFDRLLQHVQLSSAAGFVGCLRNFRLNDRDLSEITALSNQNVLDHCPRLNENACAAVSNCDNGEQCVDDWSQTLCSCRGGFLAPTCKQAQNSTGFNGGYISYKLTEAYRRRLLYNLAKSGSVPNDLFRYKRLAVENYPKQWLVMEFRTTVPNGLLFFASFTDGTLFWIDIVDEKIRFMSRAASGTPVQLMLNDGPSVSDSDWHMVSLAWQQHQDELVFRVDNFGKDAQTSYNLQPLISPNLTAMYVGGSRDGVKIGSHALKNLEGCVRKLIVNGVLQPLWTGRSTSLEAETVGDLGGECPTADVGECRGETCAGAGGDQNVRTNAGILTVTIFFACLIVSTIVAYQVVRRLRRRRQEKRAQSAASEGQATNASTLSDQRLTSLLRLRGSDGTNGSIKDSGIVLGVSRQTLAGSQISLSNPLDARPPSPLSASAYLNGYLESLSAGDLHHQHFNHHRHATPPRSSAERYDLDNASSIAPSDTDVGRHYRLYRDLTRKQPSKFIPPLQPFGGVGVGVGVGGQSAGGGAGCGTGLRIGGGSMVARPTSNSILAMMPESESSDDIMLQQNLSQLSALRPTSSTKSVRSRRRRPPPNPPGSGGGGGGGAKPPTSGSSYRSRSRRSSRRSGQSRQDLGQHDSSGSNSSSSENARSSSSSSGSGAAKIIVAVAKPPTPERRLPMPPILSPSIAMSKMGRFSDAESAVCSEFDLDKVRKPRKFFQTPDETETESDVAAYAPVAPDFEFLAGPRSIFLMSEDDDDQTIDSESTAKTASVHKPAPDGLEAYV